MVGVSPKVSFPSLVAVWPERGGLLPEVRKIIDKFHQQASKVVVVSYERWL